jgi:hypothetical protein
VFAEHPLTASQQLSGYNALATHRDPMFEEVLAEGARRKELWERVKDEWHGGYCMQLRLDYWPPRAAAIGSDASITCAPGQRVADGVGDIVARLRVAAARDGARGAPPPVRENRRNGPSHFASRAQRNPRFVFRLCAEKTFRIAARSCPVPFVHEPPR